MVRAVCISVALLLLGACGPTAPAEPPPSTPRQPAGFDDGVKLADVADLNPDPHVLEVNLEAKETELEVKPGVKTRVWTYNGSLPGPLIRAKKGDHLVVHFKNSLSVGTTIHWHGVRVPNEMDGNPLDHTVQPGGTFDYAFELKDAGTFWYHPHLASSEQVGYGLYGALIVEDPAEPDLGDDVVLMLSDIGIEADGSLTPGNDSGWFGDYFGRYGNTLLVNGKVSPTLKARRGAAQRWRVINSARARFMKFKVPGQTIVRIGGDGGLVATPQPVSELFLAPGERAELFLLPEGQPGTSMVQWIDPDIFHLNRPGPNQDLFNLELTGDGPLSPAIALPNKLSDLAPLDTTNAGAQSIELTEEVVNGTTMLGINGKPGTAPETLHALVDTTEVWTIKNTTDYDHPFHLHGFFFQVLDLNGAKPSVLEWKDTQNLPARGTMRIAVHYDDRPGMWMFHCHILDHADLGMMGMLMVMK